MGWSRQKLEELLVGMLVDMSAAQGNAKVTVLKDLRGEVRSTKTWSLGLVVIWLKTIVTWGLESVMQESVMQRQLKFKACTVRLSRPMSAH